MVDRHLLGRSIHAVAAQGPQHKKSGRQASRAHDVPERGDIGYRRVVRVYAPPPKGVHYAMRRDKEQAHLHQHRADVQDREEWVRPLASLGANSHNEEHKAQGAGHRKADEDPGGACVVVVALEERRESPSWGQGLIVLHVQRNVPFGCQPGWLPGYHPCAKFPMAVQVGGKARGLHGRKVAASTVRHGGEGGQLNEVPHGVLEDQASKAAEEHGEDDRRPTFSQHTCGVLVPEGDSGTARRQDAEERVCHPLRPQALQLSGPVEIRKHGQQPQRAEIAKHACNRRGHVVRIDAESSRHQDDEDHDGGQKD
mmetsp:Transcript_16040/g.50332  ORF Transcript_16040/g.50332 Transcript_16040/m.50332 type:complete len:311 (-) Transcript_16040:387-1319(-)